MQIIFFYEITIMMFAEKVRWVYVGRTAISPFARSLAIGLGAIFLHPYEFALCLWIITLRKGYEI